MPRGTVRSMAFHGSAWRLQVEAGGGIVLVDLPRAAAHAPPAIGTPVALRPEPVSLRLFPDTSSASAGSEEIKP
ncbi:MAG TPA: TOBE domain-containing protein [Acetobacteraceae bacterium]|nr:TOBE domain-containing protein [Acetobacteraceae bacterium]